ncbi:MAG TPA: glycosyltransferase family 4 protein, partial [Solirubrobacteraceae bacterium]|nr:glycosyltransferase family 4 protein [Solirubrobacteraceae bacterium]
DDCVALPGYVPDLGGLLAACDVFVLASRAEQSGSLAVLEAMAAGKAIVATAVDGLVEDLTDGVDGILVPPADDVALAGALRTVLLDAGLRAQLGAGARRTFAARFSAAPFAAALAGAYGRHGIAGAR